MAEQRLSYPGERIDVGIDVHQETYTVTCLCQRQMVKTATVPADPARLAESLPRWFPGARIFSGRCRKGVDMVRSITHMRGTKTPA
jgi:hypothetical protein